MSHPMKQTGTTRNIQTAKKENPNMTRTTTATARKALVIVACILACIGSILTTRVVLATPAPDAIERIDEAMGSYSVRTTFQATDSTPEATIYLEDEEDQPDAMEVVQLAQETGVQIAVVGTEDIIC